MKPQELKEIKFCFRCKTSKQIDKFCLRTLSKDGRSAYCRDCQKTYSAIWLKNHRKQQTDYVRERNRKIKLIGIEYLGGKCARCGQQFPAYVYDFHHRNPKEKEGAPALLMHRTWEKVKKELDKCALLCTNCHRIVHAENIAEFFDQSQS